MHGSSSVPAELVDLVNRYGGQMPKAMGVPMKDIQFGIERGVRKINVDTDGRIAMTAAVRKVLHETPEKFDPRDWLKPARAALKELIIGKMKDFGQAGHGSDYEAKSLEEIRRGYEQETAKA